MPVWYIMAYVNIFEEPDRHGGKNNEIDGSMRMRVLLRKENENLGMRMRVLISK